MCIMMLAGREPLLRRPIGRAPPPRDRSSMGSSEGGTSRSWVTPGADDADAGCHDVPAMVTRLDAFPGLVGRLLLEHIPGPDGRCPRCANGAQTGYQRWPCRIYSYAAAVADLENSPRSRP